MAEKEIKQARRECEITMGKFRTEMEKLAALIERHSDYTPAAFEESVRERMPNVRRHAQVFVTRLQILIEILNGRIKWSDSEGRREQQNEESRSVSVPCSLGHFNKVKAIEMGHTFREQAKKWLHQRMIRKRKPVKPATVRGWESYLERHLNPLIGDMALPYVNNGTLKMLGEKLSDAGLSPTTIRDVAKVMRWVKASAVDENGDQLYPTKWNYEFADIPVVETQHTPMFTGEEITKIIAKVAKRERVIFVLFAASGLRAGELFGLEVKHFDSHKITVAQSVWEGRVQTPKTVNAFRHVDLHPAVAAMLRDFIGDRKQGFLFQTRTGTPFLQSNFLRSSLYPILKELGIEQQGFHGFRRFRVTHLESSCVPPALVRYWTGHATSSDGEVVQQTVTDKYVKMAKDTKFRADIAERIGLGFDLPKVETLEVVPSVPGSQEMEAAASI